MSATPRVDAPQYRLLSPAAGVGAIACVGISAESVALPAILGLEILPVGALRSAQLFGVDFGVVARTAPGSALIFPHGGRAVLDALFHAMESRGFVRSNLSEFSLGWRDATAAIHGFPEARSVVEALALNALASAPSPDAVGLLLLQHDLWLGLDPNTPTDSPRDHALNHLIRPANVVAVGPANIGKSTLLNLLAGRSIAVTADESGTTRDHVGVLLELDGLVVRWTDTPGLRAAGTDIPTTTRPFAHEESLATELASRFAQQADLLVLCGDAGSAPPDSAASNPAMNMMTVQLRADLGTAAWKSDHQLSRSDGAGLERFARAVRERLVPSEYVSRAERWRFWSL